MFAINQLQLSMEEAEKRTFNGQSETIQATSNVELAAKGLREKLKKMQGIVFDEADRLHVLVDQVGVLAEDTKKAIDGSGQNVILGEKAQDIVIKIRHQV